MSLAVTPRRELLASSSSFFNRHLRTESDSEVLLNIFADEIHRAHQRCINAGNCDPNTKKTDFVFEAGERMMQVVEGAYSCICLVKGVGLCCFRDPYGIRPLVLGRRLTERGPEVSCRDRHPPPGGQLAWHLDIQDTAPPRLAAVGCRVGGLRLWPPGLRACP